MYPSPYAGAGSGAGGKIRRRPPPRAASTPYERPPAAAAAHRLATAAAAVSASSGEGGGGSGGWVSRLVDPASRLIAGGAARLFGSVFRKRLAPPSAASPQSSPPPGKNNDPTQDLPDSTNVDSPPLPEGGMGKGKSIAATSDDKALSEVEHLLMRKIFTRIEFDRLTDLLRARTIEPDPPTSIVSHEEKNEEGIRFDGMGGSTSHQMAAHESPTVKVHSHGASSPAELAKQYMSSRYSREPQSSSLRSRLFLENKSEASNTSYARRSGPPIVQAPTENPGLPVNGYVTSGLRGRSAIYRMSRSPYFKGLSSSDLNTYSLSQRTQSLHVGGKQVLKRRGGDLENEVGSIGPIRRIRQKSNMMSPFGDAHANPRGNLLTSRTSGSDFTEDTSFQGSPSSKRLLLGSSQSVRPLESHRNGGDGDSSDSAPPIPAQSNKMAEKIFEQLNIIAPSPKEKQSGQQSVIGNASNSMSKKPILQDIGPSSMHEPSSSQKFQGLDGENRPLDSDLNGSLLKKDNLNMLKDGPSKVSLSDKPAFLGNSMSASTSRKPGFKMAVIEDLPELDDDLEAPIPSKRPSSKVEVETTKQKSDSIRKEQKVEQNILEQKVESNLMKKNVVGSPVEQPVAPLSKTLSSSGGLLSSNDPGKAVPNATVDNNSGFAFSNVPPGTGPATSVSALPFAVNDDKKTDVSNSIFGIKQSITSEMETSTVKNKSPLGQSVTKLTTLDSISSERDDKSSDKVLPSDASRTLNAPLHFASAASTSPSLSNGFSHSSSPMLATVPPSDKPAVGSMMFAVSSSNPAISSSSPAFTPFSSSASAPLSMVPSSKSDGTTAEVKPATTLSFGIGGVTDVANSTASDSASKSSSKLLTSPISSSTITSMPTFSPVATSSDVAGLATAASSNTSSAPVHATSTASFTIPSSGKSLFGFSSPAQSTGLSASSVAGSTSQPPAASTLFGSKPTQSEATMQQPSQSPKPQFGSPLPSATPGGGASSSGSGTFSFGIGASSTGSGTMSFGAGASSSAPGTSSAFGAAAPSSGSGIFSFGAGTSSSGSGTVSFGVGAGAASSGPGTVSFGAGAASSGPGTVSFGAGAASSGPGTVSFGAGAASSGPGTVSFGAAASSGLGTVSFGATTSATTSTSGSGFGNSPFGTGAAFANPFSSSSGTGFTFSSPSSSAGSSTVASTSVFASTSAASSASTFSSPFSSSSSAPSTFTFGQSASSGSGFAFGAQPAPTFSSQPAPAFSSQPSVFSFTSANTSMNSPTPQPAFGMTNTNTAFGMGSPSGDQMNEDSMADDTNQAAPAPAPIFGSSPFGQQNTTPAAPVFGAPAVQQGGVFQFGGQQQAPQQNPSFPAGGSLEFQGGNFSLGSGGGGGDKSNRRIVKVKRVPKKR